MGVTMKCADVVGECDFAAWAESEEELLELVAHHAKEAHGIEEITPEVLAQVKAAIHPA